MAYACDCPPGHHDGPYYRLCVDRESTHPDIVRIRPIAPTPTTVSCEAGPMPILPDPRDARIAELEAQLVTATEKGLELAKLLDPAVVWAATQLKANADAHPGGCCVKCRAALAEVARLEALIVSTVEAATGIDADLHAEYDRIKAKP